MTKLVVILLTALFSCYGFAHDSGYVCEGLCAFDQGNGIDRRILTSEDPDALTAFNILSAECNQLDKNKQGILETIVPNINPTLADFCKFTWH